MDSTIAAAAALELETSRSKTLKERFARTNESLISRLLAWRRKVVLQESARELEVRAAAPLDCLSLNLNLNFTIVVTTPIPSRHG